VNESMEVQRVRVVDSWAVKCGNGKYLDAHAVNVVNTIIIGLLVVAAFSWMAQAWIILKAISNTYGGNPYYWYWTTVGTAIVSMVYRFVIALVNLAGVKLIIDHHRRTTLVIALFSGVFFLVGFLVDSINSDLQFLTSGVYLATGFLATLIGNYYR